MGIKNEYDSGTPMRFVFEHLTANATFMDAYRDKLFEAVRVPPKPGDTYIYVEVGKNDPILWTGIAEYVGKVAAEVKVICVRKYPTGKGSELDFGPTLRNLRRVLCGQRGVDVHDYAGNVIGSVDETRFITETQLLLKAEGSFDALHKGIKFYMSYRPPEN